MKLRVRYLAGVLAMHLLAPALLLAQAAEQAQGAARDTGGSAVWIFANLSYAGMRAQNHPSTGWRIVTFIFGFPGTLLSFFVVEEGGERAYGVDLPRRASRSADQPSELRFVRRDAEST